MVVREQPQRQALRAHWRAYGALDASYRQQQARQFQSHDHEHQLLESCLQTRDRREASCLRACSSPSCRRMLRPIQRPLEHQSRFLAFQVLYPRKPIAPIARAGTAIAANAPTPKAVPPAAIPTPPRLVATATAVPVAVAVVAPTAVALAFSLFMADYLHCDDPTGIYMY